MIALICKEIRLLLRSIVFYLLVAVVSMFYFSQYATSESWESLLAPVKPELHNAADKSPPPASMEERSEQVTSPAAEEQPALAEPPPMPEYGFQIIEDTGETAIRYKQSMVYDLEQGFYSKYKFMMIHSQVNLSAKQEAYFRQAINKLELVIQKPDAHTLEQVRQIAADLNKQLGGATNYARGAMTFVDEVNSYEEALELYQDNMEKYEVKVESGQLYPGMARLFSDYMGLTAGIFPVFLSAFLLGRARVSRMHELIHSKQIAAWKYVGAKAIALGLLLSSIYLALAVLGAWQTVSANGHPEQFMTAVASFLAYAAGWLLPTVWVSITFGMFISVLVGNGIIAIPLQLIWWFISVFPLTGSYPLSKLFLRFNTADEYDLYRQSVQAIAINRISYTGLALLLLIGTSVLWEKGRSRDVDRHGRKRKVHRNHVRPTDKAAG